MVVFISVKSSKLAELTYPLTVAYTEARPCLSNTTSIRTAIGTFWTGLENDYNVYTSYIVYMYVVLLSNQPFNLRAVTDIHIVDVA